MTKEVKTVFEKAIDKYGIQKQSMVAMEECAELIRAISKMQRKPNRNNLVEEIADVTIMIEQLKIMYQIRNTEINAVISGKIQRLAENIDKGEKQ